LNFILGKNTEFSWFRLSRQLLMLSLVSFFLSLHLQTLVKQKELDNRRLFAKQLSLERNINLELSFSQLVPDIQKEKWLLDDFDSLKHQMTKVSFEHILNQKFFQGVWDGFEIESDLFDSQQKPCFGNDTLRFAKLSKLVNLHGLPTEIEDHIYFMPHEEQGLSYIILLPLNKHKTLGLTLISKRIPEEMGFPRLLISDQAGISKSLEQYSIGKYAEGRLIHQTGDFNFPNTLGTFPPKLLQKSYFDFRGFEHSVIISGTGSAIFIATKQSTWLNLITSFAFIFVFWGALTIALNMISGQGLLIGREWSLSLKIQIAFLIILVISLFLYGLGSSIFIGQQFDAYAQQALKEKLEAKTAKLSSVFNTDLFIYDADGFLISSSRPKLFAFGLVGEHMDATAMDALIGSKNSYFSHQEQIGNLKYRSAYLPLMNEKRDLLGFINLQLFGQQQAYEQQIEEFLKSAINVFILLLALSVFIALIVSNWLIGPLQMVAKSVKNIEFGKKNQRITYQNKDEIGAIVQSYNEKLIELEAAALKLAKSERESAWRDLAQQIAHEIKNPLTPMKLSIQHLLRNLENGHPDTIEQARKALPSLIVQIDGLAAMANEFAQFAKLPEPQFEQIDFKQLIINTLPLFENNPIIDFKFSGSEFAVLADKKMLGQILNNLITNALQATQTTLNPQIELSLNSNATQIILAVKDNGIGINEAAQEKIFTPYFTTKSSGSGIGLNVVKQILEKHNGHIHFESEEGKGSCFFISLPLLSERL
jgi:signal transduction histidine kinase